MTHDPHTRCPVCWEFHRFESRACEVTRVQLAKLDDGHLCPRCLSAMARGSRCACGWQNTQPTYKVLGIDHTPLRDREADGAGCVERTSYAERVVMERA
jgi:hypothetical protein